MVILGKEHTIEGTNSTKAMLPQYLGDLGTAGQCGNSKVREEERRGEGVSREKWGRGVLARRSGGRGC